MNKKTLIYVVAALILAGIIIAGYFYFSYFQKNETVSEEKKEAIDNSTKGVLPSIENTNPMENKPDLNPINKTNPYKDIKVNPFE